MMYSGNIRKMRTQLIDGKANYWLPLYNILEPNHLVPINELIGQVISVQFEHVIHCVVTGQKIKKTYGNGMSFDAFQNSPMAVPSIINPELSRIHEGIALRDEAWEIEHHLKPHVVYLSKTSGIKVGVTRDQQIPTRWIDQGAVEALVLAEVPYRQAAGLIEVALKEFVSDKTAWQRMLKGELSEDSLLEKREQLITHVPEELKHFLIKNDSIHKIEFPLLSNPSSVKSMKLDKVPLFEKKLVGIKGQYLIFEDNTVINVRSHEGYHISLSI